jgi:hypothetical protein
MVVVGLYSLNTTLLSETGMKVLSVFFVIKMRLINTCSYRFGRSIWSIIQVASSLYPPTSVVNVFGNWLHGIDLRFRRLIRMGALAVIWALWLCRNDKIFNGKTFLSCSLSTDVPIFFVCGRLFNGWRIATSLRRSIHDWMLQRWILFPYMGGRITYGLELHLFHRCFTFSRFNMYSAFFFFIP